MLIEIVLQVHHSLSPLDFPYLLVMKLKWIQLDLKSYSIKFILFTAWFVDLSEIYIADSESSSIRAVELKTGGSRLLAGGDPVFSDNLFKVT